MKKLLLTLLVGLPAAMVADLGEHHRSGYILEAGNAVELNDADAVDLAATDISEDLSKALPEDVKNLSAVESTTPNSGPVTL